MKKILVYGSLRKGEYNFERFEDYFPNQMNYLGTVETPGYKLYSLGSYPGIKATDDDNFMLTVDKLEVSEECFQAIDGMEKGAGYTTNTITLPDGDYTIYVYQGRVSERELVHSGDWTKRKQLKTI